MQFHGRRKLLVSRTRTKIDTVTKYQRRRFFQTCQHCKEKVYQGIFISCAFSSVHDTLKYFMHFNFWHAYPVAYKLLHAVISLTSQYLKKALRKPKNKVITLLIQPCPPGIANVQVSNCLWLNEWMPPNKPHLNSEVNLQSDLSLVFLLNHLLNRKTL